MFEYLNRLENKYAWGVLGLIISLGLFVYTEVLKDTNPKLTVEILSNESVLDIKETLPDLKVLYRDVDIFSDGNTVSVIFARVVNKGNSSISVSSYDPKFPLQLSIKDGSLVRADISSGSSKYLRDNTDIISRNDTVTLPQAIIEPSQWFIVKLFVLHKVLDHPSIVATGKIANQYEINVVNEPVSDDKGFLSAAFSGKPTVQVARLFAYTFLLSGIVLFVFSTTDFISTRIQRMKRKRIVNKFKNSTKLQLNENDDLLFNVFVSQGFWTIQRMIELAGNENRLQRAVRLYNKHIDKITKQIDLLGDMSSARILYPKIEGTYTIDVKFLMDTRLIEQSEQKWVPVSERLKVAEAFANYAEIALDMNAGRMSAT